MFENVKKKLGFEVSHVNQGKRYNSKKCFYCNEIIGEDRFSFHEGEHYHKKCLKEKYNNATNE